MQAHYRSTEVCRALDKRGGTAIVNCTHTCSTSMHPPTAKPSIQCTVWSWVKLHTREGHVALTWTPQVMRGVQAPHWTPCGSGRSRSFRPRPSACHVAAATKQHAQVRPQVRRPVYVCMPSAPASKQTTLTPTVGARHWRVINTTVCACS